MLSFSFLSIQKEARPVSTRCRDFVIAAATAAAFVNKLGRVARLLQWPMSAEAAVCSRTLGSARCFVVLWACDSVRWGIPHRLVSRRTNAGEGADDCVMVAAVS